MAQQDFPQAQRVTYLISRYISGGIDFAELEELDNWRKGQPGNEGLFQELTDREKQGQVTSRMQQYDSPGSFARLKAIRTTRSGQSKAAATAVLWKKIWVAASIVLISGLIFFFYFAHKTTNELADLKPHPVYIAPGSNKAILTLAGGRRITIDQNAHGVIATQGDVQIQNTSDGKIIYAGTGQKQSSSAPEYNRIETPRAAKYQLQLPDGTHVWLNAASSLRYPVAFNGTKREVELTGEGYFEVAKDRSRPFTVISSGQRVTVLGTHFNINSYKDEKHLTTTLLEGSVQVSYGGKQALLKPGQQSALKNGTLEISKADTHLATAWKQGQLAFSGTDLQSVMRQISRWYNIDVAYIGKVPDFRISGDVSRDADLSAMLKILELYDVHFVQQGRKIIIINESR